VQGSIGLLCHRLAGEKPEKKRINMGSICHIIHLKNREAGNKKIYPGIEIRLEKPQNIEYLWSPLRGDKTDGVIDTNESHPIRVSNRGRTKTGKFLTMECGWYRCRSI
jgi:hypothetical protein